MILKGWKEKLKPAGLLLFFYFAAPALVSLLLGGADSVFGGLTFSGLAQAGLGAAFAYKLFGLKPDLNIELAAWLNKYSQPPEKTRELAGKISLAAGFVIIAAIVWPPVGEILGSGQLRALIKFSALGYAAYLGYELWKLSGPFTAAAKAAPPPPDPEEEPAPVRTRRCAKCGQLMDDTDKDCAFCGNPVQGGKE